MLPPRRLWLIASSLASAMTPIQAGLTDQNASSPISWDSWPPSPSIYSWAIANFDYSHSYMPGDAPAGYDIAVFNVTGPHVLSPRYVFNGPDPQTLIPGFRARCLYKDRDPTRSDYVGCAVDTAFLPSYYPPRAPGNWSLAVRVKAGWVGDTPGTTGFMAGRHDTLSVVFWSEYLNSTWNFTAQFAPPWNADVRWTYALSSRGSSDNPASFSAFSAFPAAAHQVGGSV